MAHKSDITPSERAALVVLALAQGERITPGKIASLTACNISTAYRLLWRISRVIPLREEGGQWALLKEQP